MEDFLTPTPYAYQKVSPRSQPGEYLRKVENNVMAEFWMLVDCPSPIIFEITTARMTSLHCESFTGVTSIIKHQKKNESSTKVVTVQDDNKEPQLADFHKHFGVLDDKYCLLMKTNDGEDLRIYTGGPCSKSHSRSIDSVAQYEMRQARPPRSAFFDYGFIGDAMNEVAACKDLQERLRCDASFTNNTMLHCVADPTKRTTADFIEATPSNLQQLAGVSPANSGQTKAIRSLKLTVEGIQGPPGTGKSTVIAHILHSSIPSSEVSLVTCVQNKAIDAIAEKLRNGVLPFFVVGNEQRLGLISQQWTIEAQVSRDPRVVLLEKTLRYFVERIELESAFIRSKEKLLNKKYLLSQREWLARIKFKKPVNDMTEEEQNARERWLVMDPWHRVWAAYIRNKYSVKLKYIKTLVRKVDILRQDLGLMRATVRAEIIATARAILATTATASGSLANNEELAPAFSKMRTVILDEAGTVPETKLPLLISLNPSGLCRIVAIGDQKQLAPFTRLSNSSGGGSPRKGQGGNVCFAFASRGYCDRGRSCRFEHVRGSPAKGRGGEGANEPPMGFFQRLEKALPQKSIPVLTEQFRMHPSVCDFVSTTFYDGGLSTNVKIGANRLRADRVGLWWLTYSDTDAESSPPRSTSKINETEALLALSLLDREDLAGKSVMVITFYKAQETLMKRMLANMGREESEALRILSVDQSQGSEADVVILSCVRSNYGSNIGFVKNANRMNVAVSRMKHQLIVIGCHTTLCTDAKWMSLYVKAKKPEGGAEGIPLLPPGRLS
jgi:hypothetical protein